ncbi:MerR HTH family regulatory protein [Modestobacter sp. DSM 44400]|uniref:MerR family transcriptional regulator n=1 Tax=Modestobacter sp. DSM 44400 TaxID=1550230 RepID=UPI00089A0EA4|nr:MerR family transcriptional regulator [Modestobacter sp. DSM 44400]SDY81873.1 MerR HTH family regulatory protein [Modestobacter sp. DSM 44400]
MRSGELARAGGVHVETLRYYERRGLLPAPPRRGSGYREYPAEALQRLQTIKQAQTLGLTLNRRAEVACGDMVQDRRSRRQVGHLVPAARLTGPHAV